MKRNQLEKLWEEYKQSEKDAHKMMNEYRAMIEANRKLIAKCQRQAKQIKRLKAELDV